jgi:hypothetical protein
MLNCLWLCLAILFVLPTFILIVRPTWFVKLVRGERIGQQSSQANRPAPAADFWGPAR